MVVNNGYSTGGGNTMTTSPASNTPTTASTNGGVARATLLCRPNSHPFNDRTLALDQEVKVGRSVARARATQTNAIFDCKVLSRNHALLWYKAGKFYLQDTKSSNGTFVNNQRLSKGSEESPPREVCSGDILQFGVDVMENSRKVTHGCIIATLKLYLPDGKEAKASPTIVNSSSNSDFASLNLPTQDLYQLNQYIQEALAREQLLETKLAVLQRLVGQTETASSDAWKSLIDEDRLLTRVEILESQLSTYGKSMNEDKLREEIKRLMEEKEEYQERAKETLKRLVNEKLEAVKKLQDVEKSLSTTEDEFATLRDLYDKNMEESKKLAAEVNRLKTDLEEAKAKIPPPAVNDEEQVNEQEAENNKNNEEDAEKIEEVAKGEEESVEVPSSSSDNAIENEEEEEEKEVNLTSIQTQETVVTQSIDEEESLGSRDQLDSLNTSTTTLDMSSESEEDNSNALSEKLVSLEAQLQEASSNVETLKEANSAINVELTVAQEQLCEALKLLDEKCRQLEEIEVQKLAAASAMAFQESKEQDEEIAKLTEEKEKVCSENEELRAEIASQLQVIEDYEQRQMAASSTSTLVGSVMEPNQQLEKSLQDAKAKISELLKVKEKYAEVSAEKSTLASNLSEMQQEMDLMSLQTRTATLCALVPFAVILLAFLASYIPFMPSFLGGGGGSENPKAD